jgi:receptor protein-tyrosine kinase
MKILVTSPSKGDGKSTILSNLGISLAEIGYSVVLVDGDIRRPHLNEIFGLTNSSGLTTLVTENTDVKTLPLEALVQKTTIQNLSVLTAGPGTTNISRVLHSKPTEELFERLNTEFDFVLIDSPPAMEFSDARLLSRFVDGAILVVRAGGTTREAAVLVKNRLIDDNVTVMGTVLNKWEAKSSSANGAYGYLYQSAKS